MVIANDHYQSIGIVCLSLVNQGAFNMSRVSGRSALSDNRPPSETPGSSLAPQSGSVRTASVVLYVVCVSISKDFK